MLAPRKKRLLPTDILRGNDAADTREQHKADVSTLMIGIRRMNSRHCHHKEAKKPQAHLRTLSYREMS
jgi:hypothetical protein